MLRAPSVLKITKKCHQAQGIQYTLVVLNQTGSAPFMRGLLFNAGSSSPCFLHFYRIKFSPIWGIEMFFFQGVSETLRHLTPSPDCFVLHDIDHIPERQGLFYRSTSSMILTVCQRSNLGLMCSPN